LRDDIKKFTDTGAHVATVAPEDGEAVARFVRDNAYPFPLLADEDHVVFDSYDVVSRLLSLGQRPAVFVIDRDGVVRFDSIGTQQWQIPSNEAVLKVISSL
jgi:peroxiredoxin